MRRMVVFSIALMILVLALPSASADRDGRPKARRARAVVINAAPGAIPATWVWDPEGITIKRGDSIRWENPTDTQHIVRPWTEGPGPQPSWGSERSLDPGRSVTFRFTKPGEYLYRCGVINHSDVWWLGDDEGRCLGMCGVITVEG